MTEDGGAIVADVFDFFAMIRLKPMTAIQFCLGKNKRNVPQDAVC